MKTRSRLLFVVVATLGVTTFVTRAEAKKATPPPRSPTPRRRAPSRPTSSALLDDVQKKILSLEDAVPADKFKWRPAPGVRSIAEAYLHIAFGNYGSAPRPPPGRSRPPTPAGR